MGGGVGIGCYEHVCEDDGSVTVTASNGASVNCAPSEAGQSKAFSGLSGALQCPAVDTVCAPPTCFDGVKNGDEEEVDCGGSRCDAFCAVHYVNASGTSFAPSTLEVARGDYVRFEWSGESHSVEQSASLGSCATAASGFSSGGPTAEGLYTLRLELNGDYAYHCAVQCAAGMTGTIVAPTRRVVVRCMCRA